MTSTNLDITPKQKEIMMLIYKFRFMSRIHIQTLQNHKDSRRINAWLKDLADKKYLGRISVRKIPENIKPAVYYAANNGVHFFEERSECNTQVLPRLRKEPYRSVRFRNYCIFLAQIYIDLLKTTNLLYTLENFLTKVDLINYENVPIPFPDTFVKLLKQNDKRKQPKRYFLELID